MSQIAGIPREWRRGPFFGAMAAFGLALILAGCQGAGPPDANAAGQSSAALMRVADDTRANGDPVTAAHLYQRVHEMKPADPKPLAKLASTLTQLGSYTEAAQAYRVALDLAPKDPDLHRGLAVVLLSLSQPETAITELEKASAQDQDDPRLFNAMGVAHDLMGRHDLAQSDYLNGLRLAPKSGGLRNNYGLSLALAGDYGAAATTLAEVANDPAAPPRYRLNLALIYGLAGDDKRAASIARGALDEASVRSNLAYYATLRALDDKARTAAIIGGQINGLPSEPSVQQADAAAKAKAPESTATPDPAAAAQQSLPAPAAPASASDAAPAPSATESMSPPAGTADAAPEASGPPVSLTRPGGSALPTDTAADPNKSEAPSTGAAASDAPASPPPSDAVAPSPGTAVGQPSPPTATSEAPPAPAPSDASVAGPAPSPAAPSKPGKTAAATTPSPKGYAVQFGSFSVEANAKKLADQLSAKGYRVAVVPHKDGAGRQWYAVRGEGYSSAAAAEAAARHIKDSERLPAVVVRQPTPGPA